MLSAGDGQNTLAYAGVRCVAFGWEHALWEQGKTEGCMCRGTRVQIKGRQDVSVAYVHVCELGRVCKSGLCRVCLPTVGSRPRPRACVG